MIVRASRGIALGLLILAIILMAIGGLADVCYQGRPFGLSRQHFWADGTFLLVLWDHTSGDAGS